MENRSEMELRTGKQITPVCQMGWWKALKTPRVHGTIQRTTRMLGVRCAARLRPITLCLLLAAAAFLPASGHNNAHRHRIRISPELVLGTAFHSPVTALSPPLRGQRSRPAPSPPRRITSQIRSISGSFAPLRFRGRYRAISSPDTRFSRSFPALSRSRRPPLPFGPLQPSGSKRSTVPTARSSPCRTPDILLLPAALSFNHASDLSFRTRCRPAQQIVP
jgi:hypothetical protein